MTPASVSPAEWLVNPETGMWTCRVGIRRNGRLCYGQSTVPAEHYDNRAMRALIEHECAEAALRETPK